MTQGWNRSSNNSNHTISGTNDVIVTKTGNTFGTHTSTAAVELVSAGKRYFELVITTTGGNVAVGVTNVTLVNATGITDQVNAIGWFSFAGAGSTSYNSAFGNSMPAFVQGDRLSIAVDATADLLWGRVNGGTWGPSGDPAAGTGGQSISGITGAVGPAVTLADLNDEVDGSFASGSWVYTAPTGFSAYDSSSFGTITAVTNVAGVGVSAARTLGTVTAVANVAGVGASAANHGTITAVTNVAGVGKSTARSVGAVTAVAVVQGVSSLLSIVGDISLNPIGEQPPEIPFDVSGTYELLPSLQFADDASSVFTDIGVANITPIGVVTFGFTHPGMPSGTHVIRVSDLSTGTSAAEGYFVDPTAVPGRAALLANSPTAIQFIIPAYLYEQYRDDQDCQAFIDAYNGIAQTYLDWFNNINLPIYTGLSGALLDWVAQGLYGIARPSIALSQTSGSGAFNAYKLDQIPIDGSAASTTSQVFVATDEIFKRIITWLFYKGDGRQFSVTWLKRRIMRFLNGVAGTDPGVDQAYQVSVQFTGTTVVNISISQGSAPTTYAPVLRAALLSGVIPLPFQFTYNVLLT